MIISENREAEFSLFQSLMLSTNEYLNNEAINSPAKLKGLEGTKLEPYVAEVVNYLAEGTQFENTIKLYGGNRFPDIVANKFYGIEVKSTTGNHWTSVGNSILESTRIEDVEHIFMLFGKLGSPVEFKVRPYQDCLSDIVVTHYPRYLINMELPDGDTIFDKIGMSYESLRLLDKPTIPVSQYYRSHLRKGQSLWWLGDSAEEIETPSPVTITMWNSLDRGKRSLLIAEGMVNYPEVLLSNSPGKYNDFTLWLIIQNGILIPNVRDIFSAGGTLDITTPARKYSKLPQVFNSIIESRDLILYFLQVADRSTLCKNWHKAITNDKDRLETWIQLVASHGPSAYQQRNIEILKYIFFR